MNGVSRAPGGKPLIASTGYCREFLRSYNLRELQGDLPSGRRWRGCLVLMFQTIYAEGLMTEPV
jgi:hypothetical protein